MNYLAVTDLYGNSVVSNNLNPFILLHIEDPNIILEEINTLVCNQYGSFWKFNPKNISYMLNKFGLDSAKYAPLGHMWFPVERLRGRVVLLLANINKSISSYPIDYVKLNQFGKGYIWKPVAPIGYTGVGYMYSLYKPSVKQMRVVSNEHVVEKSIQSKSYKKNTIMNEYNYLGQMDSPFFTIKKKGNIPAHTIQGEERSYKRNKVNRDHNWNIDNEVRSTGTDIDSLESNDSWITPKGKFVVLVEPDEPWFIRKSREEENKRTPIKMQQKLGKIIGVDMNRKSEQKFTPDFKMDYRKPHLGYGHSYKSRLCGKDCECDNKARNQKQNQKNSVQNKNNVYENFEGEDQSLFSKTVNIFMLCLFITIITLLVCRLYVELKAQR